ncbi:hypothetical protein AOLI_G00291200 [Acnodon oligacanthus]
MTMSPKTQTEDRGGFYFEGEVLRCSSEEEDYSSNSTEDETTTATPFIPDGDKPLNPGAKQESSLTALTFSPTLLRVEGDGAFVLEGHSGRQHVPLLISQAVTRLKELKRLSRVCTPECSMADELVYSVLRGHSIEQQRFHQE